MERGTVRELGYKAVQDIAAAAAASVLEALGIQSGEMCRRQVGRVYGSWAVQAIRDGRLKGRNAGGKIMYRVADILALRAADYAAAEVQLKNIEAK